MPSYCRHFPQGLAVHPGLIRAKRPIALYAVAMVEQLPYDLVGTLEGGIEIRRYPEHSLVSVDVEAGMADAGNLGFRPLVTYISGYNTAGKSIAMTAPVFQAPQGGATQTVSFVLPEGSTRWPEPSDSRVRVERRSESLVAALRFRGLWREDTVLEKERELLAGLEESPYRAIGSAYFARYNPPSVPGIFRRNEVLVEVEHPTAR